MSNSPLRQLTYPLLKQGLSTKEIIKRTGGSKTSINKHRIEIFGPSRRKRQYDWVEIQKYYDAGNSWRGVMEKFGLCHATLAWARKNGYLVFRKKTEAATLAWTSGRQNPEIYKTPEHRKIMSKFGGLKPRAGRCKKVLYTKQDGTTVWLQGSWELS